MLRQRRILLSSAHAPRWVRLYVQPIEDFWAVMVVDEEEPPPEPGELKGIVFFGKTVQEGESVAEFYIDRSGPTN